jgi:flagellar basal body-associated protein FliL
MAETDDVDPEGAVHLETEAQTVAEPALRAHRSGALGEIVRRPIILAGAGLAISLSLVTASVVFSASQDEGERHAVSIAVAGPPTLHAFPELIADLQSSARKPHFIRVAVVVELPRDAVGKLTEAQTPILADVQQYLRDLERQDLVGSDGMERLRHAILSIIDLHIGPNQARSVLFTTFLVD